MKWVLYDFKTSKEPWFEAAEQTYIEKIGHFVKFEVVHLKTNKLDRDQAEQKRKFEETVLSEKLTNDDFIVLFDERGKKYDSISFAKLIEKSQSSGKKRGVLIIGGAFGVSEEIRKKASSIVSLSDLVMNHLVAEAVVLEQFYRAQTILNRIPYHNS